MQGKSYGHTARVSDQINYLIGKYGVPDFFSSVEILLAQMVMGFGRYIPSISVPKMIEKIRHDSSRAIIPGDPEGPAFTSAPAKTTGRSHEYQPAGGSHPGRSRGQVLRKIFTSFILFLHIEKIIDTPEIRPREICLITICKNVQFNNSLLWHIFCCFKFY